jgi:large repetitive protein
VPVPQLLTAISEWLKAETAAGRIADDCRRLLPAVGIPPRRVGQRYGRAVPGRAARNRQPPAEPVARVGAQVPADLVVDRSQHSALVAELRPPDGQEGVPTTEAGFALVATRPFSIAGTVEDPHGTPLAGAAVLLLQQDQNQRLTTVTDSRGSYSLSLNPAYYTGGYWLQVTAPGYATGFLDLAAVTNGANLSETFVLPKLGSLTGLITDAGQTPPGPVAGAGVQAVISTSDPLIAGSVRATADASGRYQLQLPPGPTGITVKASGFETYTTTVTIVADGTVNQDISLVPASAGLACTVSVAGSGNITDPGSGRPIINAVVYVSGGRPGPLTHNGSYTVIQIPAGEQKITVNAPGFKPYQSSFPFTAHQTMSMDLTLDPVHPAPSPGPHPPM